MKEHEFYLKNAERTKNPLGKAMFKQIGDDELEHYERLKQLKAEWDKKGIWPETLPLKVNETEINAILTKFLEKADGAATSDNDDLQAVRIAIEFEAKGTEFYKKLRDAVTDKKEKDFFDLLAKIEYEHYRSLKDVEEYFISPADWYRAHEHHTLDGA
jgi:rubrerythrin